MPYTRENNFELEVYDLSDDTTVTHGPTSITNTFTPEVGFIYELVDLYISIPDPVGSSAGTHRLSIQGADGNEKIFISANTGTNISFKYLYGSGTTAFPANAANGRDLLTNFLTTNEYPLDFVYTNSTDVDQSGTRTMILTLKKWRNPL